MTLDKLHELLGLCALINIGVLFFWFLMLAFLKDFVYKVHTRWFEISKESFNTIHYAGLMFFKLIVFIFNIIPWIALTIMKT